MMELYFKDINPKVVTCGKLITEKLLCNALGVDKSGQLWHHGIPGQKWGKRNGPPYPLDESARSPEERREAESGPGEDRGKAKTPQEKDIAKQKSSSLKKGIRNLRTKIAEHESKISDPAKYYPKWSAFDDREKAGFIKHWQKEIKIFQRNIDARIAELRERGDYNDE